MRKGWFGPKRIGWGISPRGWQGWVVTVVFIASVAATMRWLRPTLEASTALPSAALTFAILAFWLGLLSLVIWLTYERDDSKR